MTPIALAPAPVAPSEPTYAEKEAAFDLLLRSGLVREHTNLYTLLVYLGKKSLEPNVEPLKEYTIGVEALGKPQDYDPRIDSTVRVDISKLRAKLKDYYQQEGTRSPLRLEIPRGRYDLVYQRVPHLPAPQALPLPAVEMPAPVTSSRYFWPVAGGVLLLILVLAASGVGL